MSQVPGTGPEFTAGPIPVGPPLTRAQRKAREIGTKGSPERDKHNATRRRDNTREQVVREFIAWDGEGVTRADGSHEYVQMASSAGDQLAQTTQLRTMDVFDLILNSERENPDAIHVIYGGRYDFNCWLVDVDHKTLEQLYTQPFVEWMGYRLAWRQGKSLFLSDHTTNVTMYDTVSFFQCSFVKACDSYLGDRFVHRELIAEQKMLRSSFNTDDLATIIRYNAAELENLVLLMDELRDRLHKVGLRPTRWDGPGAIASALLKRENIQDARSEDIPEPVAIAARHAYAGGRFEVVRYGHVRQPAYEYDINSAYPAAMRWLPDLSLGRWERVLGDPGREAFAVYRVRYSSDVARSVHLPGPFWHRLKDGQIRYPTACEGWYWSPEVQMAREYCRTIGGTMTVVEAWVFRPENNKRPFDFIDGLYLKRRALKKAGDGAHVGIKLALNSMYGKLAQQVGWRRNKDGSVQIPPFHQMEWAGWITSHARSLVMEAAMSDPEAIIAFETDAVFSSRPLKLNVGTGLGQWERTEFKELTYIQSGLYFGTLKDGSVVEKTRGVDRGTLELDDVLGYLSQQDERVAPAQLTRFVGLGIALKQGMHKWRRWETVTKMMKLGPQNKRQHCVPLPGEPLLEFHCCDDSNVVDGIWHKTFCPLEPGWDELSAEFPVEWLSGREPDENEQAHHGEERMFGDGDRD